MPSGIEIRESMLVASKAKARRQSSKLEQFNLTVQSFRSLSPLFVVTEGCRKHAIHDHSGNELHGSS